MLVREIRSINGENYDLIGNVNKYIRSLIRERRIIKREELLQAFMFERKKAGEEIEFLSLDRNGKVIAERKGVLEDDFVVLTRLDPEGNEVWRDQKGNTSNLVIAVDNFEKNYCRLGESGMCMPKERSRILAKIDRNLILRKGNYEERVSLGGVIDVTDAVMRMEEVFVVSKAVLETFYL